MPPDFPIQVNETASTVTVAAGISQRAVLEYLAAYTHWTEPAGWTLPAFSWFIDQTIGGAIATATHGSSLRWGSLSSQVRGLKIILANGTTLELKSPDENPHLWRALGVSVGRLGVITEVTLRIVPATPVTRTSRKVKFDQFVDELFEIQEEYKSDKTKNDTDGMKTALAPLDEALCFWVLPTGDIFRADFTHENKSADSVILNLTTPIIEALDGPPQDAPLPGVFEQQPHPALPPNYFDFAGPMDPETLRDLAQQGEPFFETYAYNGTFPRHAAYLAVTEGDAKLTDLTAPMDQYEVAIPIERAADCLKELGDAIYGPEELWTAFRSASNIRFINGEEFYLSPANGGPVM